MHRRSVLHQQPGQTIRPHNASSSASQKTKRQQTQQQPARPAGGPRAIEVQQARHVHCAPGSVRTTARSLPAPKSAPDLIRPARSHSRCCRNCDHGERPVNRDCTLSFLHRPSAYFCTNVHTQVCGNESNTMNVPVLSIRGPPHDVQGGGATDQGTTSSEVPHSRQF